LSIVITKRAQMQGSEFILDKLIAKSSYVA
jgi:hypothetical protein